MVVDARMTVVGREGRRTALTRQSRSQRENTMDKISVRGDKFAVDSFNEIGPIEVRVMVFRHVDAEVVSKCIGVVPFQKRGKPYSMFP